MLLSTKGFGQGSTGRGDQFKMDMVGLSSTEQVTKRPKRHEEKKESLKVLKLLYPTKYRNRHGFSKGP